MINFAALHEVECKYWLCRKEFTPANKAQRYCSEACQREAERDRQKRVKTDMKARETRCK